jgi:hypothetical protein
MDHVRVGISLVPQLLFSELVYVSCFVSCIVVCVIMTWDGSGAERSRVAVVIDPAPLLMDCSVYLTPSLC